jgi:hypothetical protein
MFLSNVAWYLSKIKNLATAEGMFFIWISLRGKSPLEQVSVEIKARLFNNLGVAEAGLKMRTC